MIPARRNIIPDSKNRRREPLFFTLEEHARLAEIAEREGYRSIGEMITRYVLKDILRRKQRKITIE